MEIEELKRNVNRCVTVYDNAYRDKLNVIFVPNYVVIAPDQTVKELGISWMLANRGKAERDYSGMELSTNQGPVDVYWLGRLKVLDLKELRIMGREKNVHYRTGGILPLILTIQNRFYNIRRFFGGKRFVNPVFADVGVPAQQLEQMLSRQISGRKRR